MERFFTCKEAASRYSVKISTIRGWIKNKKLQAIKTGREYRISETAFLRFEESQKTM